MNARIDEELALLRKAYPDLEYLESGHWILLRDRPLSDGMWDQGAADVCFQVPEQIPGQAPYGFYVRPNLTLRDRQPIGNYAFPAPTAFGADWGKFSWQLDGWAPQADVVAGTNMVNFARSISERLKQGA